MAVTTEEQRKIFDERGFLPMRELLRADEIAHYGAAVDRAVAARSAHETRPLAERSLYSSPSTR